MKNDFSQVGLEKLAALVKVSDELLVAFLNEHKDIKYVQVSAKTGQSVDDAFMKMAEELMHRMHQKQQQRDKDLVNLHSGEIGINECEARTGNGCCGGTG